MSERREQCVALNESGRRCRRVAVSVEHYFGDHELYGYDQPRPQWVRVALCVRHSEPPKREGQSRG